MILSEIDGVVSNYLHRSQLAANGQWEEFHAASADDVPMPAMIELLDQHHHWGHEINFITGRPERMRMETVEWLDEQGIIYDRLHMKPDNWYISPSEYKLKACNIYTPAWVTVVYDCDHRSIQIWRDLGYHCHQVALPLF